MKLFKKIKVLVSVDPRATILNPTCSEVKYNYTVFICQTAVHGRTSTASNFPQFRISGSKSRKSKVGKKSRLETVLFFKILVV